MKIMGRNININGDIISFDVDNINFDCDYQEQRMAEEFYDRQKDKVMTDILMLLMTSDEELAVQLSDPNAEVRSKAEMIMKVKTLIRGEKV